MDDSVSQLPTTWHGPNRHDGNRVWHWRPTAVWFGCQACGETRDWQRPDSENIIRWTCSHRQPVCRVTCFKLVERCPEACAKGSE